MNLPILIVLACSVALITLLNIHADVVAQLGLYGVTLLHIGSSAMLNMLRGDVHGFFDQFVDLDLKNRGRHMVTDGTTMMDFIIGMYVDYANYGVWGIVQRIVGGPARVQILREFDQQPTRCYEQLGCITFTRAWYDKHQRPYNTLPMDYDDIKSQFTLTQGDMSVVFDSDLKEFEPVLRHFNASLPTVVYIHGYISSSSDAKAIQLKEALRKFDRVNFISVDWERGARQIYTVSMCNTLLVALEAVQLLQRLQALAGLQPRHVHLVGQSMGAHIAGYIGSRIPGLGRITGLDPAKPGFDHMPVQVRLDPNDALYVQVIHTDTGSEQWALPGFGMRDTCGHVDVFVNGGVLQPDCHDTARFLDHVMVGNVACRHNKAAHLFIATIQPVDRCRTIAHECASYQRYTSGLCTRCDPGNNTCVQVGYRSSPDLLTNRSGVKTFVQTAADGVSCQVHYSLQFDVETASPEASRGQMAITMIGSQDNVSTTLPPPSPTPTTTTEPHLSSNTFLTYVKQTVNWLIVHLTEYQNQTPKTTINLGPGKTYSFLLMSDNDLGQIQRLLLTWLPEASGNTDRLDHAVTIREVQLRSMAHLYSAPTLEFRSREARKTIKLPAGKITTLHAHRQ